MKKLIIAVAVALAACDAPEEEAAPRADIVETASDSTAIAPDSVRNEVGVTDMTDGRANAPTQFDAKQIRTGASIAGMTVAAANLSPAQTDLGMSGSVKFSGQTEVTGSYRAHFDYPEVKQSCFWVDVESWPKLPRAAGDTRLIWFCFANAQQAIAQLGALGSQARATIVIDDYTTHLQQSDAWDTARLVRVVKKEPF